MLALGAGALVLAADPQARPDDTVLPISWNDAYFRVIDQPDYAALDKGEVLYKLKQLGPDTAMAQTMGLVKATPEASFRVARDYNHYVQVMPYTEESREVRTFKLTGANYPGAEAVDFWTLVNVFGYQTRYLLRIGHLVDAQKQTYRTLWTLVSEPEKVAGCKDKRGRACENDLATNLGSHQFEPYKGDPKRTLHTYTVRLVGKSWFQRQALAFAGGNSMKEVTLAIRTTAEKP
jgi:hypothetical protein